MKLAPISHVAPVREMSMILGAYFGARFLGEGTSFAESSDRLSSSPECGGSPGLMLQRHSIVPRLVRANEKAAISSQPFF